MKFIFKFELFLIIVSIFSSFVLSEQILTDSTINTVKEEDIQKSSHFCTIKSSCSSGENAILYVNDYNYASVNKITTYNNLLCCTGITLSTFSSSKECVSGSTPLLWYEMGALYSKKQPWGSPSNPLCIKGVISCSTDPTKGKFILNLNSAQVYYTKQNTGENIYCKFSDVDFNFDGKVNQLDKTGMNSKIKTLFASSSNDFTIINDLLWKFQTEYVHDDSVLRIADTTISDINPKIYTGEISTSTNNPNEKILPKI